MSNEKDRNISRDTRYIMKHLEVDASTALLLENEARDNPMFNNKMTAWKSEESSYRSRLLRAVKELSSHGEKHSRS